MLAVVEGTVVKEKNKTVTSQADFLAGRHTFCIISYSPRCFRPPNRGAMNTHSEVMVRGKKYGRFSDSLV